MPSSTSRPQSPTTSVGNLASAVEPATTPAPLSSNHLLKGRKAIEITHNGSVYRLQATKLGKLILTK
ncbi:hemin uptake protein HemP [Ottowia thiooxydans]|uniref:Hemin uptake protein HemP n=1 Tax=Ottowia thiooxydans TaxID=219182 RepID=A0ABV2QCP7_9BURK